MKAGVIKTGEEVTVITISKKNGAVQYYSSDGICHQYRFNDKEIGFTNAASARSVDWEQRRHEIAKDVLTASFAQPVSAINLPSYVHICVQWTNVLIDGLKKKSKYAGQERYIINKLQTDKINYFTEFYLNLFHTGLIYYAIQDNDLSFDIFRNGINEIRKAEKEGKDEYIPRGWEKV